MKVKLNLWLSRDLTLYGKTLLAKSLGVSQLVYATSMFSVPTTIIKNVQSELFLFLWKNKKRQNKKSGHLSTAQGGRTAFRQLCYDGKIIATSLDE